MYIRPATVMGCCSIVGASCRYTAWDKVDTYYTRRFVIRVMRLAIESTSEILLRNEHPCCWLGISFHTEATLESILLSYIIPFHYSNFKTVTSGLLAIALQYMASISECLVGRLVASCLPVVVDHHPNVLNAQSRARDSLRTRMYRFLRNWHHTVGRLYHRAS